MTHITISYMNLSNSSTSVRSIVWRPVLLQMKATGGRRRASGKGLTVFQPEPRPFHLSRNCQSDSTYPTFLKNVCHTYFQHNYKKVCNFYIYQNTIINDIILVKCSPHVFTTKNSEFSRIFGLDT